MKHIPIVGEHLYIYTPSTRYMVEMVRDPYTVDSVSANTCTVREARLIFNGPRYFNTLADDIVDDPDGRKIKLRWSEKNQRWEETPKRYGCTHVAVFGRWDYQPYLD